MTRVFLFIQYGASVMCVLGTHRPLVLGLYLFFGGPLPLYEGVLVTSSSDGSGMAHDCL
jgi:hypothetical protein